MGFSREQLELVSRATFSSCLSPPLFSCWRVVTRGNIHLPAVERDVSYDRP